MFAKHICQHWTRGTYTVANGFIPFPFLGVNLRVATLKNANLQNCDLRTAVLAGADLENCDLSGCDLHEANLRGANLKGAAFELMVNPLHMSQTVP